MSFSGPELGRGVAARRSSTSAATQDGFHGAIMGRASLLKEKTSGEREHVVKRSPGPSRLQAVASQRQRPLQRKPPEPLRRAVADCLSSSHHGMSPALHSEAVRALQDYLADTKTIDVAYTVLIEHALAERDRSPPVVAKCVALLKRYLFRYIPRIQTLQQIDFFCVNLIAECNAVTNKKSSSWVQSANSEHAASNISGNSSSTSSTSVAFASEALVKSLNYVRALVSKHIPKHSFQSPLFAANSHTSSKRYSPTLSSLRSRSFGSQLSPGGIAGRGSPEIEEAAKSAIMNIVGLETIDEEDLNYIALDVFKSQWIRGKHQQSWTPSPVMTDSGGIARPQIDSKYDILERGAAALLMKGQLGKTTDRRTSPGFLTEQLLQPSTLTTVTDTASARSHLRSIAASKRIKTGTHQIWEDVPVNTWRRRPRPLFHYRHYSEQQPLRLSAVEVEEVIAAVCLEGSITSNNTVSSMPSLPSNQAGRVTVETADVAASVLIKLVIDMYMADSRTAAPLLLSMLEGMLSSLQSTVRTRAFDLVLNLGIHAQLLKPMRGEEQPTVVEVPSSQSTRFFDGNQFFGTAKENSKSYNLEGGTPQAVREFEIWLLNILCEILLFLVQIEEKEEGVWASALSCLMYMICDRGRIQRRRLNGLDVRVLKALLEISRENSWAEELHCGLIRLLSNLLYNICDGEEKPSPGAIGLDIQQIELIGGIEFICEEYARANAVEAKNNLFGVLFGYVLHQPKSKWLTTGKSMPVDDEIQAIATVLALADAPEAFAVALKLGLHGVGEELKKSIVKSMSRDVTSGHLNTELLEDIVESLDSVVSYYAHLDDEFSEMLQITMVNESLIHIQEGPKEQNTIEDSVSVSRAWTTLDYLLHSSRAIYRQNGYFWLVELLFAEIVRESNRMKVQNLQQQFGLFGVSERSDSDHFEEQSLSHVSSSLRLLSGLLKSKYNYIRWGFILILERLLLRCQLSVLDENRAHGEADGREYRQVGTNGLYAEDKANAVIGLMNAALSQIFLANETDRIMILKMCDLLFSQLCLRIYPSMVPSIQNNAYIRDNTTFGSLTNSSDVYDKSDNLLFRTDQGERNFGDGRHLNRSGSGFLQYGYKSTSMAALLLRGYAAAPRQLVACIPTALLYWPLIQLAGAATDDIALGIAVGSKGRGNIPGGASDIRGALLLLLIGKCTTDQTAFQEVGGEEFFRSLLDDTDARVAYYTSAFLLKRMMTEEPEKYQSKLHDIVFKAQQSNNEKLLENPYLQMRGILQLSSDLGSQLSF
ncbi:uncharacterized protein LOC131026903 isoform X1 [Cryptomeria japonica]|uniref:uncharacterized protein LOC131026903 isoform X1 n=1 Tax=Cryptomeria japonica TaxID=3369 RepID=UPI0027D9ED24|nr:uncharacterized protein LOC131026903 isoform X1 [Cryptomeria japonica]